MTTAYVKLSKMDICRLLEAKAKEELAVISLWSKSRRELLRNELNELFFTLDYIDSEIEKQEKESMSDEVPF